MIPATTSEPGSNVDSGSPSPSPPAIARPDPDGAPVLDEQLRRGRLGEHRHAERLGLLGEEAAERGDREDDVAVIAHRGRRRNADGRAAGHEIHGLAGNLAIGRNVRHREPALEEPAERSRVDDRAREEMRAGLLALLEHGHRNLAEALAHLGVLLEQLAEPDRAGEPSRAGAHDRDADLDALLERIGGRADGVGRPECRCEVAWPRHLRTGGSNELGQLRHDLVQVADDADVAEVEDRCIRVLVDRDDRAGALHPDLVLDGAGDTARDVELRRHGLPRLTDLRRVRVPAGIDDGARGCDGSAERRRELLEQREGLGRAQSTATGDDDVRVLDRRPARRLDRLADQRRKGREAGERRLERLDLRRATGLDRVERAGAYEAEPRRARPADVDQDRVTQRLTLADELVATELDVGEIPVEARLEPCREPCGDVRRKNGGREEDGIRSGLLDERFERVDAWLRERGCEGFVLAGVRLRGAIGARARSQLPAPGPSTTPAASPREAAFERTPSPPFSSWPS